MEPVTRTPKASKVASEDVINSMPDNVVTNILDRLPIQYVVRTAILSRNWRFRWTMLTKLVFDEKFYEYLVGLGIENRYDGRTISRLLLHLKGPITKFVLYIPKDKLLDVEEIKVFTLENMHVTPLKLSTHLFCCVKLERLKLRNCSLHPTPTFCGFPNLLCLDLYQVAFESRNCGEIITQCPLLKILQIIDGDPNGKYKLEEIAKLKNLKMLNLPLRGLDNTVITSSLIFDLRCYLPKLVILVLDFRDCELLGEAGARKWVRTSFHHLKKLRLCPIDFSSVNKLSFAFEMIWGLPKLQNIEILAQSNDVVPPPAFNSSELNITVGELQLQDVVFRSFSGSENEIWLIKNLLACSPLLKKIAIHPCSSLALGGDNRKLRLATKLLKLHRASTRAEVEIYWS